MKKSVKKHGRPAVLALAALMVLGMVLSSAAAPSSVFLRPDAAEEEPEFESAVTLDGEAVDQAEYVYSYAPEYGHVFAAAFSVGSETWSFLAALPEELCLEGAEYAGDEIEKGGILFEVIAVDMEIAAVETYNSAAYPQVFEDLSVRIESVTPYEQARFHLSGTVHLTGRDAEIAVAGQAEYTESAAADTGTNAASTGNVCGACGGTGLCGICGGSGVCQVCFGRGGMSVTTYGMGGDDWVVCQGCHGDRQCKYCDRGRCSYCGGTGMT